MAVHTRRAWPLAPPTSHRGATPRSRPHLAHFVALEDFGFSSAPAGGAPFGAPYSPGPAYPLIGFCRVCLRPAAPAAIRSSSTGTGGGTELGQPAHRFLHHSRSLAPSSPSGRPHHLKAAARSVQLRPMATTGGLTPHTLTRVAADSLRSPLNLRLDVATPATVVCRPPMREGRQLPNRAAGAAS